MQRQTWATHRSAPTPPFTVPQWCSTFSLFSLAPFLLGEGVRPRVLLSVCPTLPEEGGRFGNSGSVRVHAPPPPVGVKHFWVPGFSKKLGESRWGRTQAVPPAPKRGCVDRNPFDVPKEAPQMPWTPNLKQNEIHLSHMSATKGSGKINCFLGFSKGSCVTFDNRIKFWRPRRRIS